MEDLKVKEVAQMFRVSRTAVCKWFEAGRFPNAYRVGRDIRIPAADVEAFKRPARESA